MHRALPFVLVPFLVLPGCFLDRSGSGLDVDAGGPSMDAGLADAGGGRTDAGASEDAGEVSDAGRDDAGVEPPSDGGGDGGSDAGSDGGVDAGFDGGFDAGFDGGFDAGFDAGFDGGFDAGFDGGFDAGFDSGTDAGPPSCDTLYGGASGYILCVETPTECEFYTTNNRVRTCSSTCASFGGTCLRRWRDAAGAGNECVHRDSSPRGCGAVGNVTDICVCSRP